MMMIVRLILAETKPSSEQQLMGFKFVIGNLHRAIADDNLDAYVVAGVWNVHRLHIRTHTFDHFQVADA